MIGMEGERESKNPTLSSQHDDDDDPSFMLDSADNFILTTRLSQKEYNNKNNEACSFRFQPVTNYSSFTIDNLNLTYYFLLNTL